MRLTENGYVTDPGEHVVLEAETGRISANGQPIGQATFIPGRAIPGAAPAPAQEGVAYSAAGGAEAVYANTVAVLLGNGEFVLDFVQVEPGRPAILRSRVVLTEQTFRALLDALGDTWAKYKSQ